MDGCPPRSSTCPTGTRAVGPAQIVIGGRARPCAPATRPRSEAEIAEIVRWRREHQPGGPNAGSVFTNPPDDSAGRLIEASRGQGPPRRHGRGLDQARQLHPGRRGWRADDVLALMVEVRGGSIDGHRRPPPPRDPAGRLRREVSTVDRGFVTQTLGSRPGRSDDRPAEVDPRIQARRDEVERDQARRRRRWMLGLATVATVLAVAWLATHSPLLAVRARRRRRHAARAGRRGRRGGRDPRRPAPRRRRRRRRPGPPARVCRGWPTAHVSVGWGGTAHLSVTERTPVAAVAEGNARWMLVDRQGRALGLAPAVPAGVMAVRGVAGVGAGSVFGAGLSAPLEVIAGSAPGPAQPRGGHDRERATARSPSACARAAWPSCASPSTSPGSWPP